MYLFMDGKLVYESKDILKKTGLKIYMMMFMMIDSWKGFIIICYVVDGFVYVYDVV